MFQCLSETVEEETLHYGLNCNTLDTLMTIRYELLCSSSCSSRQIAVLDFYNYIQYSSASAEITDYQLVFPNPHE